MEEEGSGVRSCRCYLIRVAHGGRGSRRGGGGFWSLLGGAAGGDPIVGLIVVEDERERANPVGNYSRGVKSTKKLGFLS